MTGLFNLLLLLSEIQTSNLNFEQLFFEINIEFKQLCKNSGRLYVGMHIDSFINLISCFYTFKTYKCTDLCSNFEQFQVYEGFVKYYKKLI